MSTSCTGVPKRCALVKSSRLAPSAKVVGGWDHAGSLDLSSSASPMSSPSGPRI
jgi:hypothetical protein